MFSNTSCCHKWSCQFLANMPKALLFTAYLPLYTTCCRRMLDFRQHEALS